MEQAGKVRKEGIMELNYFLHPTVALLLVQFFI
jgi:hypothetical protein